MFVIEQLQILGIIPNKDVKESSHANEKGCSQIEHISKSINYIAIINCMYVL